MRSRWGGKREGGYLEEIFRLQKRSFKKRIPFAAPK
jgi:hypothetical protein